MITSGPDGLARTRLVATDLDGTLLRSDGSLSLRTREALAQVQSRGIDVVVVTGRPARWLSPVLDDAGLVGPVICANGALLYDPFGQRILAHRAMPAETAADLIRQLRFRLPGVAFAFELGLDFRFERSYRPSLASPDEYVAVDDALAVADVPVTKLLAKHPRLGAHDMLAAAIEAADGRAEVTHSTATLLEITAAGVTKASALAELCAQRGIARHDVLAFGDAHNDLALLEWAGLGVAVANAQPQLLAHASWVAPSSDEDGVAQVLERLVSSP